MSIEDVKTGTRYITEVKRLRKSDIVRVSQRMGWHFDWRLELEHKDRQVYKLLMASDSHIQGLISLESVDNYLELHLIETAPHNFGKNKKFQGVPNNLVAFACKTSFEPGFEGNVAFQAKSRLIQHYIESLGAQVLYKERMGIYGESARKLINLHYEDYFK